MTHWLELLLTFGVFIPLLSFGFLVFFGHRLGKPKSAYVATGAIALSCLLSLIVLIGWNALDASTQAAKTADAYRFHWADLGTVPLEIGVKLDSLTVIMYFMVTFVSTCIHVFSIGYMAGHSDEVNHKSMYHRFFMYLSLFCFSMLGLVVSSNLLFLFIFWELVGLCSYLLIGFYFDKKYATNAGMKAFITNRVGDFGFIVGLAMVLFFLGTTDLEGAAKAFSEQYRTSTGIFAASIDLFGFHISGMALATLMGIGLFCGAMGKSAQFPLHVWLPDAMAGPTPVSALIHAATMVAAGVYLVARVYRLLTPDAQFFIAVIGCITLTLTALVAIVQTDIKKVLAYSTLSQLGYMIFGLGAGAWIAALFHLMTHAFFKAMLFLCSGQVIEGCHHEQDIRQMGGLRKKMPWTCWTFFVGVLAIAGAGIPGTPIGIGGFFSKDEILAVGYDRAFAWGESAAEHSDGHASAGPATGREPFGFTHGDAHGEPAAVLASFAEDEHGHATPAAHPGAAGVGGHETSSHVNQQQKAELARNTPPLPPLMFWLPIIIAYVTPFYMMRCWTLTFWGKPRNEEVHHHAHESKLMYVPLIVLAVGTLFSSYFLFRPMLAEAAPAATNASLIVGIDGHAHEADHAAGLMVSHGAHSALISLVGFAFIAGMLLAFVIYRNGLGIGERLAAALRPAHLLLERKFFFDEVYDLFVVRGGVFLAHVARAFDNYVIDLLFNLSAKITERLAAFTGRVLDADGLTSGKWAQENRRSAAWLLVVALVVLGIYGFNAQMYWVTAACGVLMLFMFGVDGMVNGIGAGAHDASDVVRAPQNGLIRNYLLYVVGAAAILICLIVWFGGRIASVLAA